MGDMWNECGFELIIKGGVYFSFSLLKKIYYWHIILYNVMLVSTIQQSEPAIHISCPCTASLPHPTPLGHHRAPG